MRFHRPVMAVAVLVVSVCLIQWFATAAPVIPSREKMPDELRCLKDIKRVTVSVGKLPPSIRAAGVSEANLRESAVARLKAEGFEVVEELSDIRLVIQCFTAVDPDIANTVALTTIIGVNQRVNLQRMDEEMTLPVASIVTTAVGKSDLLRNLTTREVEAAATMFLRFTEQANTH